MRITTIIAIAASILAFGVAPPAAGENGAGQDAACWKSGTTADIGTCFAASAKRSDADLNRTYSQIMSVLDADDRQRLQNAERLWVAYRDAACGAEYHLWQGGTGGPPARLACIDGETRHHLDYLRTTYRLRLQRLAAPVAPTAAPTIDPAATDGRPKDWRVIRTDYVEFCAAHAAIINVANGSLHGSIGACDPRRNDPARQIDERADPNDTAALRAMLSNLKSSALMDQACLAARKDAPRMVIVLSGPVALTIERDGKTTTIDTRSPCLTNTGRNLLNLVGRMTEPLRALGLR